MLKVASFGGRSQKIQKHSFWNFQIPVNLARIKFNFENFSGSHITNRVNGGRMDGNSVNGFHFPVLIQVPGRETPQYFASSDRIEDGRSEKQTPRHSLTRRPIFR
jgi:hypothetical protein